MLEAKLSKPIKVLNKLEQCDEKRIAHTLL